MIALAYARGSCSGAAAHIKFRYPPIFIDGLVDHLEPICLTVSDCAVVPDFGKI
jgi:hypothetical protein